MSSMNRPERIEDKLLIDLAITEEKKRLLIEEAKPSFHPMISPKS
jgi:hypothetical protein